MTGDAEDDLDLETLLGLLFDQFHYDFRHYARASLRRQLVGLDPHCATWGQTHG